MTESTQVRSAGEIHCGACQHPNTNDVKFCAGCGHGLFEPCVKCSKPVLLTQKFCGSCGGDLVESQQKKSDQLDQWMAQAVTEAKEHRFDIAIALLERVRTSADYRHAEVSQNAVAAMAKIRELRDSTSEAAEDLQEQAKQAFDADQLPKAIALLQRVPENLLTEDSRQLYKKCSTTVEQVTALTAEVQSAMKSRNWPLLGSLLNQLLGLAPENEDYQKLAAKVSAKIREHATRALSEHAYDKASELLQSVPDTARDESFETLSQNIENARWYSGQFDKEPLATPMLGRLAVRFSKVAPEDQSIQEMLKKLVVAVKQPPGPRHGFSAWEQPKASWLGGDQGLLVTPQSIDCGERPEFRKFRARFTVALGLALQGLNRARVTENFLPVKKSRLSVLSRRKAETAWGIDIGTSSLRAVRLEVKDDVVRVVDLQFIPFESPLCRADVTSPEAAIRSAVEAFIEGKEKDLETTPVWINLSMRDVVTRIVCLPPTKDKQASQMLDAETEAAIPLPLDEVSVVRWIADMANDASIGRPAMVCAARKKVIENRVENIKAAGLNVTGVQCDSVAIINFVAHEFADELSPADDKAAGAEATDDVARDQDVAIAVVDCGAMTTNVVVVGKRDHAAWSIDTGGEDLTTLLARATKSTLHDAEKLKQDPALIEQPAEAFAPLEEKMQATRQRLLQAVLRGSAPDSDDSPISRVTQTWCVGGGSFCHGWLRRVISEKE